MKPCIVRARTGWAVVHLRDTGSPIGPLWYDPRGLWLGICDHCRWHDWAITRTAAAEALWRHYLDEHKEQSQ